MTDVLDDFTTRLIGRAGMIDLAAVAAPELAAEGFRDREGAADVRLPKARRGLRLGAYPVIIAMADLTATALAEQVRALHAQVLIARSYLSQAEVVDLHLLLVADVPEPTATHWAIADRLERDEAICRKLVWIRQRDPDTSFAAFAARTFLARPWQDDGGVRPANLSLDRPTDIVAETLAEQGLPAGAAAAWVRLTEEHIRAGKVDPGGFVERLVAAMEAQNG